MAGTEIPLRLNVDETATLPQLESAEQVRHDPGSCFCELLPGSELTAAALFPGHVALRTGEMGPPEWWSDDASNIAALHLFKLTDAFLFPSFGVVVRAGGDVMRLPMQDTAYMTPDLSGLPSTCRRGDELMLDVPESIETLPRSALVMALGARVNYGHFMLDALPAAVSIAKTGQFDGHPFHVPPLHDWQRRHFELLGIEPVELPHDVYRVGELVYTSGMHHYLHTPNFNYQDVRARQLQRVVHTDRECPRRIFLSRSNYTNRTMVSEDALRRRLARLGFVAIDPATLSVDEQIALFHQAEIVVGSAGAAFSNVLYCEPGTVVIEIQPAGMQNQWVRNICLQNRCRFMAYFCDVLDAHPEKPQVDLRFDLDVERFLEAIKSFAKLDTVRAPATRGWLAKLFSRQSR